MTGPGSDTFLRRGGVLTVETLVDLWQFLNERKKWWLLPIIVVIMIFGLMVVVTSNSAVAPFVYTVF